MKRTILIIPLLSIFLSSYSQYKLDLSKVKPIPLTYLDLGHSGPVGKEIKVNNLYMEEGGKPVLPVMGEFHYSRMDSRYWKDTLLKMKASGVNIVATYCLWMLHEEIQGRQDWTGSRDLRKFIELCHQLDLKVHLRIGPYCNAEIRNGGLPDWLINNKSLRPRSNDPLYLEYSRNWYQGVYNQVEGLLYKDGGPIMAVQLENEYVTKGMIISHLMTLKKMAVEIGFDVPLYTMTHWMDTEYPKGEIVPYAGFYIETPWISNGGKISPPTDFEFFTYNRLSDNIGTDIIRVEGDVESFDGEKNDSPFFTCEIGVGTFASYHRRAVVPEKMAGENINLRLGCGANLMGYYMYVGGTNPIGEKQAFGSSIDFGYDYQAPIREFGTLGKVMKETKKFNYLMNDYGEEMAPLKSYLPLTNKNRNNLQWAVRTDGEKGYLFCSNYLYKHDRKDYKNVQFDLKLKEESLKIPRKSMTVANGTYFAWAFNADLDGLTLKYSTTQPICKHDSQGGVKSYFFFADNGVSPEYLIASKHIKDIEVSGGNSKQEKGQYFIENLVPGKDCVISITKNDGSKVKIITLTKEDSNYIWKGKVKNKDIIAITKSSLVFDEDRIRITDDIPNQEVRVYNTDSESGFVKQAFNSPAYPELKAEMRRIAPMDKALWISPKEGDVVQQKFNGESVAIIKQVTLRYVSDNNAKCVFNGKDFESKKIGDYNIANLTDAFVVGENVLSFKLSGTNKAIVGEVEVIYKNGARFIWNTDNTWLSGNSNNPVLVDHKKAKPNQYAQEEHLAVYEINAKDLDKSKPETRLYIKFVGNIISAFIGQQQINDTYYDGSEWILGLSRYEHLLAGNPLTIKITGFKSMEEIIYLEDFASQKEGIDPHIKGLTTTQEYHYSVD